MREQRKGVGCIKSGTDEIETLENGSKSRESVKTCEAVISNYTRGKS